MSDRCDDGGANKGNNSGGGRGEGGGGGGGGGGVGEGGGGSGGQVKQLSAFFESKSQPPAVVPSTPRPPKTQPSVNSQSSSSKDVRKGESRGSEKSGDGEESGGGRSQEEKQKGNEGEEERIFHLDADYVLRWKQSVSEEKWKEEGKVDLPDHQGFTKIVVGIKAKKEIPASTDEIYAEEIKRLGLRFNPVTKVEGIEKLGGIVTVWGHECGFDSFPHWMEELPSLEQIFLRRNYILEIPPSFMKKESLFNFSAQSNARLTSIPSPGPKLTYLRVQDCNIQSLPNDLFSSSLKVVDLSGNPSELLPICQFVNAVYNEAYS